ncbi:nitroreductase family protein [uncultured Methanocorpusculum sp.]|nr:nitroreductase family protein [uncultured Methanocorpusculum sp.]
MDIQQAIIERHSVRSFTDQRIEGEIKSSLEEAIEECNRESGLNIQLCLDEPNAFGGMRAHYGKFENCKNYIALIGKAGTDEICGYYGEKLVLKAQQLGLNTCWVAMTYNKSKAPCILNKGEKIQIVIALGHGKTAGRPHKSKDMMQLSRVEGEMADWFKRGMEAAMLAPTAVNQQKFIITQNGNTVSAKPLAAFFSKFDIGIVKYHFEIGAGKENFSWKED